MLLSRSVCVCIMLLHWCVCVCATSMSSLCLLRCLAEACPLWLEEYELRAHHTESLEDNAT